MFPVVFSPVLFLGISSSASIVFRFRRVGGKNIDPTRPALCGTPPRPGPPIQPSGGLFSLPLVSPPALPKPLPNHRFCRSPSPCCSLSPFLPSVLARRTLARERLGSVIALGIIIGFVGSVFVGVVVVGVWFRVLEDLGATDIAVSDFVSCIGAESMRFVVCVVTVSCVGVLSVAVVGKVA